MAEEQVSPLAQIAKPDQLAQTAGGGNTMAAEMFQNLMNNGKQRQSYLGQRQKEYSAELEKYAAMVQQSQQPEAHEAQRWGAMADAASSVAPTWGNTGAMLGRVGGAYGKASEQELNDNLKSQSELTKLRQQEVRALETKDQNAAMARALTPRGGAGAGTDVIKVVDGKLVRYDRLTGQTEVLSGSQDQVKAKLYKTFYDAAVKNEVPDPEEYAQLQVEKTLQGFGGTTVTGRTNNIPGVHSAMIPPGEEPGVPPKGRGTVDVASTLTALMSPEDQATAQRLVARINANPAAAANDTKTLENIIKKYDERNKPATSISYIDKPKRKMEEGTAEVTGKALGEEQKSLNLAATQSGKMLSQLDLMEKLATNPDMPEGELGPYIQQFRSGAKSLGFEVGNETNAANLLDSMAKNYALHIRTADGSNLLPGAMSNYEDKLLQTISNLGLSATAEGRMATIQLMREVAKTNMRFGKEANMLADKNRGILPSDWNARRERIMKEEMARLAHVNQSIAAQFKGDK